MKTEETTPVRDRNHISQGLIATGLAFDIHMHKDANRISHDSTCNFHGQFSLTDQDHPPDIGKPTYRKCTDVASIQLPMQQK